MHTGMSFDGLDPETGTDLVRMLREADIEASYFEFEDDWEGELLTERGIRCRNADRDKARRLIDAYLSSKPLTE